MSSSLAELRARLPELTLRDEFRLRRRLDGARGAGVPAALAEDVEKAAARAAKRRAAIPAVSYPSDLPITARKDDILAAVRDHQVVVIAGETGSGKTTQLPKICLELGRGVRGTIGHTQPRRIAARTVAERISAELAVEVGTAVGYQVRFTDRATEDTAVKVMTDGILLAEIQHDRMLRRYDTLIIDEAHERSLNIDFLLGYLKQLLPRRPDLKLIITSATIDPERFSAHFGDAPIVEVSGRTYPVEVRYRPPEDGVDQIEAITAAVDELGLEAPGDVLVFLPASGRSGTPPTRCAGTCPTAPRCCRCSPGCPRPTSTRCSRRTPAAGSCSRPTSPRRRSPCPESGTWSIPAPPGSPGTAPAPRCSGCRSSGSRRRARTSARAGAGVPLTASASGSTPRRTSSPGPGSPSRRCSGPTSPR